ncbi:putative nucleic acid-binding protein [Pedobacter sp. UYP30]|uniref:PIN domain-containing protein n=1 Tax=Pedobacter sp. UYP30 TaxID=1756400 RepID=UPI003399152F
MSDSIFLDSNVALYAFDHGSLKNKVALALLETRPIISTQVVLESVNICLKKFKFSKEISFEHGAHLMSICSLVLIDAGTINLAFDISIRYQFSYWDSLIISSAIQNRCRKLYSEDLQHNQVINESLTIVNPFLT